MFDLVILEGQDDAAHGQVPQQDQPYRCRRHHGQQDQSLLMFFDPVGCQTPSFRHVCQLLPHIPHHSFPAELDLVYILVRPASKVMRLGWPFLFLVVDFDRAEQV